MIYILLIVFSKSKIAQIGINKDTESTLNQAFSIDKCGKTR